MRIRILAIGDKMPQWINEGFLEYRKRFAPPFSLELIEIPAEKRTKQSDIKRLIQYEGEKLIATIKPNHFVIALHVQGKTWDTEILAKKLKDWQNEGRNIDFLIGGPDGLSSDCLQKAELQWSLSALTLPHPLVRVILAEQLYRAITINQNHPYHR